MLPGGRPSHGRVVARGPGRVNLIGEHTDYNCGLCLPFAIEQGVTVTAEATHDDAIEAVAADLGEIDRFPADRIEPAAGWRAFVRGMVSELRAVGHDVPGARITIEGDVPRGAGLSSSAALETALGLTFVALADRTREMDRLHLARLCSRVENDWVGAETGLLDQIAALLCEEGHALRIDLATLDVRPVRLDLRGWRLATLDSGVRRSLAASGYNRRRAECRTACGLLGLDSLRVATLDDVERLPPPLDRRVRHVVEENGRVDLAVAALEGGHVAELGELLDRSHASLRDLYEVSVPEVERSVEQVKRAGASGARIMGGGFGGAVLALFPPGVGLPPAAVEVRPGPPARLLEGQPAQPGA